MESPGHRENILRPEFRRVGIGVVSGPLGLMVVQVFTG
ncbi:MAG: CAP domain-containing protein [Actinomycetota bacterium]